MAAYLPPLENLPIFNTELFIDGTDLLDINTANKLYLRFPYAQGTQNMLDINMLGTITFPSSGNTLNAQGWTGNVNSTVSSSNSTRYLTFSDSSLSGTGPLQKNPNFNINPSTNEITIGTSLKVSDAATKKILIGTSAGQTNQSNNSIAIGGLAGQTNQGSECIAIGLSAGNGGQSAAAVAIGQNAGFLNQGSNSVSIGRSAGTNTQLANSVAIGHNAGTTNQNIQSVAIGYESGNINQGSSSVAVGYLAGNTSQATNAIAIGATAGRHSQATNAIAIGNSAGTGDATGTKSQKTLAVAVGYLAGNDTQGTQAVAIGGQSGQELQGTSAVAVGYGAGNDTQGTNAIAIGINSGQTTQGSSSIAIGVNSGNATQGTNSVAIGVSAGKTTQGNGCVAIGNLAGEVNQGLNCIAIGIESGKNNGASLATKTICIGQQAGINGVASNSIVIGNLAGQVDRSAHTVGSIILNASGSGLESPNDGSFIVNPIRTRASNAGGFPLFYNNNEITQHNSVNPLIFQTPITTGGTIRLSPRVSTPLPYVIECVGDTTASVLNINTPIRLQTDARTLNNQNYLGYYTKINASLNVTSPFGYNGIIQLTPVINLAIGTYMVNFYFMMSGSIPSGNANATLNYLNYNLSTSTTAFSTDPIDEKRVISGIRLRDDNTTREFSYNVSRVLTRATTSALYLLFQADFTGIATGNVFTPSTDSYVEIVKIA